MGWFTGARDHDCGDTDFGEVGFDGGIPVTTIGCQQRWWRAEEFGDAFDGWSDQVDVAGVTDVDGVIEDDPVDVVDSLGFVAELDGFAEAAFADRACIRFEQ